MTQGGAPTGVAVDHGREIRAYVRDPDGHLIEIGQATGVLEALEDQA